MLTRTFCHLPGVGVRTEEKLWAAGVRGWDDFALAAPLLSAHRHAQAAALLDESRERLEAGDAEFFAARLPAQEHWRLWPHFRDATAYVDIETTGLGRGNDHITSIALFDGRSLRTYVHGRNLESFQDDILDYKLLVTYNGRSFDAPFIEREMRIVLPKAHVDLRFVLKRVGLTGGLKRCEKALGLDRAELDGVDGYFAVLLWKRFLDTGDEKALQTLLAYNAEDVLNLGTLLRYASERLLAATPFASDVSLPCCAPVDNPHQADEALVRRLKSIYYR
ncbi:exonuclease-like protein [Desulfovibrio sp. X2]|uniref:ribonuclease H-like domain-containing protein n=1 Tax=Desulfovibrio sp. X2 TaxID=941449 RepID=UPI0003589793|nr:ribonuclease H-like domain-containing protein [Desulfovibrio sp. X2]EPR42657.1 exonuclease-like protein [Desulfovibrio sp. X2]